MKAEKQSDLDCLVLRRIVFARFLEMSMSLTPRSSGSFPMNRSVPLDQETDERMKFHARKKAITVTELARRFIHEGLARLEKTTRETTKT